MFPFTQYPLPFLVLQFLPLASRYWKNAFIYSDHNSISFQWLNCILNEHILVTFNSSTRQFQYLIKIPLDDCFVHIQLQCKQNMSTLKRSEKLDYLGGDLQCGLTRFD